MTREEAISHIESLFPADSEYAESAELGKELLLESIIRHWRCLPTVILIGYARLCIETDAEE